MPKEEQKIETPKTWLEHNMEGEHAVVSGGPTDIIPEEAKKSAPNTESSTPPVDAEAKTTESTADSESSSEPNSLPAAPDDFPQITFGAEAKSVQKQEPTKDVDPLASLPKDILTRLLTDPESVVAEIEEKVLARTQQTEQTKKQAEAVWKDFYQKHPDLETSRELVDLVTQKLSIQWRSEGKTVSWGEGSKRLAEDVRKLVQTIRDGSSDEVDTSRRAPMVSSSGLSAPRGVMKPAEQPKTFSDQLKSYQKRMGVGKLKDTNAN